MLNELKRMPPRVSRRRAVTLTVFTIALLCSPQLSFSQRVGGTQVGGPGGPGSRLGSPVVADFTPSDDRPRSEPKVLFLPPPSISEQKILTALEQPAHFDFTEFTLQEVAGVIAEKYGIPVMLATRVLDESGITPDTPVTRKIIGVPLRSALKILLAALDLEAVIRDDVLLVTTPDDASNWLITRVYPVGDLAESTQDYQSLMNLLTSIVKPTTWHKVGGPGEIAGARSTRSLVISNTLLVHEDVLALLSSMREARRLNLEQPAEAPRLPANR